MKCRHDYGLCSSGRGRNSFEETPTPTCAYACRVDYAFRLLNPPVADAGTHTTIGWLSRACVYAGEIRTFVCLSNKSWYVVCRASVVDVWCCVGQL